MNTLEKHIEICKALLLEDEGYIASCNLKDFEFEIGCEGKLSPYIFKLLDKLNYYYEQPSDESSHLFIYEKASDEAIKRENEFKRVRIEEHEIQEYFKKCALAKRQLCEQPTFAETRRFMELYGFDVDAIEAQIKECKCITDI